MEIDLKEFKRQKEAIAKVAATEISNKIAEIKRLLGEIKELVEVTGIEVRIDREISDDLEEVNRLHPEWNTSSYDC